VSNSLATSCHNCHLRTHKTAAKTLFNHLLPPVAEHPSTAHPPDSKWNERLGPPRVRRQRDTPRSPRIRDRRQSLAKEVVQFMATRWLLAIGHPGSSREVTHWYTRGRLKRPAPALTTRGILGVGGEGAELGSRLPHTCTAFPRAGLECCCRSSSHRPIIRQDQYLGRQTSNGRKP